MVASNKGINNSNDNNTNSEIVNKNMEYCQTLLESACIPLLVIDGDSYLFVDCNQAALDLYALTSKEQIIGKTPMVVSVELQAGGELSAEKMYDYMNEALDKGEVVFEWRHKRKNEEVWLAEVYLKTFMHNNKKLIQCNLIDITQRKEAEEKNCEINNMLQTILSSTNDGMLAVSANGVVLFSNSKFKKMWRIPQTLIDAADDGVLLEHVKQQLKEPELFATKTTALYSDYNEDFEMIEFIDGRVFERYSLPLVRDSSIIGRLYSFRDVTNKKLLEQLQNNVNMFLDVRLRITEMANSVTVAELIEYVLQEITIMTNSNKTRFYFYKAELFSAPAKEQKDIDELIDQVTLELLKKNKRTIMVDDNRRVILPVTAGTELAAVLIADKLNEGFNQLDVNNMQKVLEITWSLIEQKYLQERLLASENKFRTYIEKAPIAVIVIDKNGNYVDVNQFTVDLTGYSRAELLQMKVGGFNDPEDVHTAKEKLIELVQNGNAEGEMLFRKKTGEKFWGYLYASIVSEQECIGFLTDITEDKNAEVEMCRLRDEALAAARIKSNFLAVMSHEIRTPMNTIIGMGELLRETKLTTDQANYVDIFNRSGDNLLRIINDILDVSKLEAGKIEIEKSAFNLSNLFNELAKIYQLKNSNPQIGTVAAQDVKFLAEIDEAINIDVLGDAVRIYQVISNLLSNAFKFTKHGHVKLTVNCTEKTEDMITVTCIVEDTGIGIATEHTDKIFDMFSQADSSTTRKYGGTGLGLSIVRLIVEKMDATIDLSSQEGIGSKFTFVFKLAISKAVKKVLNNDEIKSAHKLLQKKERARVLLAEDSVDNQFLVKAFLKNEPFIVDIANNGLEAVVMHKRNRYDLILMDVEMPEKDGLEATLEIRQWEKDNKISAVPICTLTAHVMNEQRELMVEAGVNDYMTKPIGKHDLIRMVHNNINY